MSISYLTYARDARKSTFQIRFLKFLWSELFCRGVIKSKSDIGECQSIAIFQDNGRSGRKPLIVQKRAIYRSDLFDQGKTLIILHDLGMTSRNKSHGIFIG